MLVTVNKLKHMTYHGSYVLKITTCETLMVTHVLVKNLQNMCQKLLPVHAERECRQKSRKANAKLFTLHANKITYSVIRYLVSVAY